MRCTDYYPTSFPTLGPEIRFTNIQVPSQMDEDETTEQVFSRKDRKAYRAEVLKQRTAEQTNAGPKTSTLGEAKQARSKTKRKARP